MRPNQEQDALDDPPSRLDHEPLCAAVAADDLHRQDGNGGHRSLHLPRIVAGIGKDDLKPGEARANTRQDERCAVAVLRAGRVDHDAQRQPLGVDQGVDLAPLHTLAGVVAHLVVFRAPFSADLIVWLSRMAPLGLASRPRRSRIATRNSAQIASHVPSRWNLRKML